MPKDTSKTHVLSPCSLSDCILSVYVGDCMTIWYRHILLSGYKGCGAVDCTSVPAHMHAHVHVGICICNNLTKNVLFVLHTLQVCVQIMYVQ